MKTKKTFAENYLREGLLKFCKLHFIFILLIILQTILYDSAHLITPELVLNRWIAISGLLMVNAIIWYLVKIKAGHALLCKSLILLMILSDMGLASFEVYTQRGMAARAVFLFVMPIIVSGLLLSRAALYATALLSIAVYTLTAVSYFVLNFNEGYKVELYGEVGFYSVMFLLVAGLISTVAHSKQ